MTASVALPQPCTSRLTKDWVDSLQHFLTTTIKEGKTRNPPNRKVIKGQPACQVTSTCISAVCRGAQLDKRWWTSLHQRFAWRGGLLCQPVKKNYHWNLRRFKLLRFFWFLETFTFEVVFFFLVFVGLSQFEDLCQGPFCCSGSCRRWVHHHIHRIRPGSI